MGVLPERGPGGDVEVSIVIPVKDEGPNIERLAGEVTSVMEGETWSWECVWVDDGSTDDSRSLLEEINTRDGRHQFVFLSRNYGQSAALHAGFRNAKGRIIATLDGDGQNDPGDIPVLLRELAARDADMVNGWRRERRDSPIRKISSRIANGFRNRVTGDSVRDVGCSMRVFRRRCVEDVPLFRGMHRFLPTLVRMAGHTKVIEVPVGHRPRRAGRTKYGVQNRLWVGLADTLAVRWMRSRMVYPEVKATSFSRGEGGKA